MKIKNIFKLSVRGGLLILLSLLNFKYAFPSDEEYSGNIEFVSPSEINLLQLKKTELKNLDHRIFQILKEADHLVRRHVGYRHDNPYRKLTRTDLYRIHHTQRQLSCSEFVWYVFSMSGLPMGNTHIETKYMAFHHHIYSKALYKVKDNTIRPGDILVYDYPLLEIVMERKRIGRFLSGHVVIVVSADKKIVVGSHGRGESSPHHAPTGAGYRRLTNGWDNWTMDRTLKAVYRIQPQSPQNR